MKSVLSKVISLLVVAPSLLAIVASRCHAAPANDDFANAQTIAAGSSFSVTGTDVGATREAFENTPSYPLTDVAYTVWYTWTPTVSGYLQIDTSHPTEKGVFRAPTADAQSFMAADPGDGSAATFVHVDAGQKYYFSLGNDSSPAAFTFTGTITDEPGFFTGEAVLGDGVNYLAFADGKPFGYYSYLSDSRYFYHYDLGYEFVFDAKDGKNGVYLYDFASKTFFYTSPTFPFPYLYDFTLKTVLYYYPDTKKAGHYTTNPRDFYNFATGKIITK